MHWVLSEKEARLLDVIGMAVKRKEEKHAGIGDLGEHEKQANDPHRWVSLDMSVIASQESHAVTMENE